MENRIRLKKPMLVKSDGPYARTNAWMKKFYSKSSPLVGHEAEHSLNLMDW
jgi:hypothetical protein